ncbi:L-glutamate gamma-semialdehyde dehydrogenase [Paenibacillus allorhizosphaerae]|uniref:L-glutamate gamma-semialdehyde dehydrogenase n=1 Tax=Paenibacillus allorhizosphaerae TaxID=2849866 RepID=A0ABM8VBV0_9BACL|nr:L-glutamate gamma-semialdehyde dehydrogenase [Paenibacillus allorhizosphaerae]CAG7622056.1 1-pyrroline-5-carboxylate dehydrogenase 2 [Paenibacillus allorhizosphaerae]
MLEPFRNEPLTNFSDPQEKQSFEASIRKVESEGGRVYPIRIGSERIVTARKLDSVNPASPAEVVGTVAQVDMALANKAVLASAAAFESWRKIAAPQRARYLYKTAALLRRRKHEFSAWMVLEAGKSWSEADADTAEAIDFLEYYGREMERLTERQPLVRIPGEDNEWTYIPLGVGIIIPPWNFPLAIMAGMTAAAIVAGNTVVLKPASATPVVAAKFVELLEEAGLPDGVVCFVPGSGSEVGDVLVDHPLTRFISFTGSREVGLRINERAALTAPGQKWIKRVVAEMGGKDAIIVDSDADLELAAEAIAASAFGFAGQKCSACSRAIVVGPVYNDILRRVVERTKSLVTGDPKRAGVYIGPVIDKKAYDKISEYIEIGKSEGKLVAGGKANDPSQGFFIEPTIFADVAPNARIAQEEIFGPVLAFLRAATFEEALEIANGTDYGLTGSVISNNRAHLEAARESFHVGNLYFNRKCTGALVGVHPFGGFNMSGTDSKAGGRDYLLLFTQPKVVSERL